MSWLPFFNAFVVFVAVVSFFLWKLAGVLLFVGMVSVSVCFLLKELFYTGQRFVFGFWLFIMTEAILFFSLFTGCLWNESPDSEPISEFLELPFLGSFLLLGSSITVTAYHHGKGLSWGRWCLWATLVLGGCFMVLQMYEFYDCECNWSDSVYYAVCFSTVGLHFLHVLIGATGLAILLYMGSSNLSDFYSDIVVWYWHFVDYIWLLVFMVVYLS
uniref:Cytochrome c oxidase subunit 3 n=1 Tax=Diplodiscus japonicus TaxID=1895467 RepID=A0A977R6H1_9TREM|nr:cytochrome c oxidase subunit III [Diplodiscus japonicus]UXL86276.1 cytochrome c oxidase subunit 3 [Diplodiscus japonicus]